MMMTEKEEAVEEVDHDDADDVDRFLWGVIRSGNFPLCVLFLE